MPETYVPTKPTEADVAAARELSAVHADLRARRISVDEARARTRAVHAKHGTESGGCASALATFRIAAGAR